MIVARPRRMFGALLYVAAFPVLFTAYVVVEGLGAIPLEPGLIASILGFLFLLWLLPGAVLFSQLTSTIEVDEAGLTRRLLLLGPRHISWSGVREVVQQVAGGPALLIRTDRGRLVVSERIHERGDEAIARILSEARSRGIPVRTLGANLDAAR